jgi:hypothetical protein
MIREQKGSVSFGMSAAPQCLAQEMLYRGLTAQPKLYLEGRSVFV